MKRNLIAIIGIAAVLVIGAIAYYFINQSRAYNVTFKLDPAVKSVTIRNVETSKEASATDNQVVKLRNGSYTYQITGDNLSDITRSFTVDAADKTITVPVAYTSKYLTEVAADIQPTIEAKLKKTYGAAMNRYVVNNIVVFDDAKWGGVVLAPSDMDPSNPSGLYRLLIEYKDEAWQLNGAPHIALTKYTNQNVSVDTLSKVNSLTAR